MCGIGGYCGGWGGVGIAEEVGFLCLLEFLSACLPLLACATLRARCFYGTRTASRALWQR